MKLYEICEHITKQNLIQVEKFADSLWNKLGIEIQFTKHFIDRLNDERNIKPISVAELIRLFKKEYERNGKAIINNPEDEAVMKDLFTNLNIPFIIQTKHGEKELVAKTILRKKDFATSNKEFIVK